MEPRKGKNKKSIFHVFLQVFKFTLIGIIILSGIYFFNQVSLSPNFPIKSVKVYGANHIEHAEVQNLLVPLVNKGFFNVNVEYIRERLLALPWVADIFVKREWPDKIEIKIVEKNPIANWNDESLLSANGEVFTPDAKTYPKHVPKFNGPTGHQIVMIKYFVDINRMLLPLHVKISYLELTPYFTWKLTLDNGISLQLGHKDILTRLDQFVKVYPKIVGNRASDVESIDLRYPNGMAVRWKQPIST